MSQIGPKLVAAESRKCSAAAAFKILGAIRMNWPVQRSEATMPIGVVSPLARLRLRAIRLMEMGQPMNVAWREASGAAVTALGKWDEQQRESRSVE
jgi:hypothetical protein